MYRDERALYEMKKEYVKKEMSLEAVALMKQRMQQAKEELRNEREQRFDAAYDAAKADSADSKGSETTSEHKDSTQKKKSGGGNLLTFSFINRYAGIAAAALVFLLVLPNASASAAYAMGNLPVVGGLFRVLTVRHYQHLDERSMMSVQMPMLAMNENEEGIPAGGPYDEEADTYDGSSDDMEECMELPMTAEDSAQEINQEMQEIVDRYVADFKELVGTENFQDLIINPEIIQSTDEYFTILLKCYYGSADGYQENHYYTVSSLTGERLQLKDLFKENTDYAAVVESEIAEQMRSMEAEGLAAFWIDDEESFGFDLAEEIKISEFYVNQDGNITISFQEGAVAAMSEGIQEFTLTSEGVQELRKELGK